MWNKISDTTECIIDEMGCHTDESGSRTMNRCGIDGYAYQCTRCHKIGYFKRDNSGFVWSNATGWDTKEDKEAIINALREARP